jgi:hypothetical protein
MSDRPACPFSRERGRDAASPYRYAVLAKIWSEAEMRDLSRRPRLD